MPKNFHQTKKGPGRTALKTPAQLYAEEIIRRGDGPEPGYFPGAKLTRKALRQQIGKGTIK